MKRDRPAQRRRTKQTESVNPALRQRRYHFQEADRFLQLVNFLNASPDDVGELEKALQPAVFALYVTPVSETDGLPTSEGVFLQISAKELVRVRRELDEILAPLIAEPPSKSFSVTSKTKVRPEDRERVRAADRARGRLYKIVSAYTPSLVYTDGAFHLSLSSHTRRDWPFWAALIEFLLQPNWRAKLGHCPYCHRYFRKRRGDQIFDRENCRKRYWEALREDDP